MLWKVTYRNKNGHIDSIFLEAKSRSELFPLLSTKNIRPIRIENEGHKLQTTTSKIKLKIPVLLTSAAVCIITSCIICTTLKKEDTKHEDKCITKEKRVHQAVQAPLVQQSITNSTSEKYDRIEQIKAEFKKLPDEEKLKLHFEHLQSSEIDLAPKTNMPFRTGLEKSLCRIFMTEVGDPPPPPPAAWLSIGDEAHLAQILLASNPIIDGDSDRVKEAKETVELAKEEFKKFIKDGNNPHDFLPYYYEKLNSAWNERLETAKEIKRISAEEPDIAREFYELSNARLKEKGIKPIELSSEMKKKLGLED